jgi:hypothetical protein
MSADAALLDDLTQTAGRLARVYGALAEQTQDRREGLRWYEAFDRCFFSYRVGVALKLRLARMVHAQPTVPAAEREAERQETLETERGDDPGERLEHTERDRDRDTERASFPLLLKTLGGLVTEAEKLPGPHPAELLTLKELLATVGASPTAQPQASKTRLAASAAAPVMALERPKAPLRLGVPPRRATGPPRR